MQNLLQPELFYLGLVHAQCSVYFCLGHCFCLEDWIHLIGDCWGSGHTLSNKSGGQWPLFLSPFTSGGTIFSHVFGFRVNLFTLWESSRWGDDLICCLHHPLPKECNSYIWFCETYSQPIWRNFWACVYKQNHTFLRAVRETSQDNCLSRSLFFAKTGVSYNVYFLQQAFLLTAFHSLSLHSWSTV